MTDGGEYFATGEKAAAVVRGTDFAQVLDMAVGDLCSYLKRRASNGKENIGGGILRQRDNQKSR